MSDERKMGRRRFLIATGGIMAASALMCGGATVVASQTPTIDFVHSECGRRPTMNKVLVAYASKCGSTGEVAQAIAQELCARGMTVDVRRVSEVKDAAEYDAFVVGSAIRMGSWLGEAKKFVETNAAVLQAAPTAFFTVHMLNTDDSEESKTNRAAYVAPIHAVVQPQAEAFFAGKIDLGKMSFLDRMISKMMGAQDEDKRDWDAVKQWANQLAPQFA
jgi:menaquinone-dependent protoporphyrinogen oxidase